MGTATGIEWTDATWNPIRGCSRVSEGCRHCYAERVARRFSQHGQPYEGLVRIGPTGNKRGEWNGQIRFVEEHLLDPLRWRKPKRIFVNSMSDLFHENVTDEMRDRIFAVMALCPQHTFQVLTKRPEQMRAYVMSTKARLSYGPPIVIGRQNAIRDLIDQYCPDSIERDKARTAVSGSWDAKAEPLPNVWLGVSVEDQKTADARIPLLLKTPAAVRFLSAEPLLGPVKTRAVLNDEFDIDWLTGEVIETDPCSDHDRFRYGVKLDWVIAGGESGPDARPMHPVWVRSLRDQCVAAGVPFFFKQWGEWLPFDQREAGQIANSACYTCAYESSAGLMFVAAAGTAVNADLQAAGKPGWWCVGKKAAGHLLDGTEWRQFPEVRA